MSKVNRFNLRHQLGGGGLGQVFLADEVATGNEVAIKLFIPAGDEVIEQLVGDEPDGGEALAHRFMEYSYQLAELEPGSFIAPVLEVGQTDEGVPYYVTPYLPDSLADLIGCDLTDPARLADLSENHQPRPLAVDRALAVMEQLLVALATAHDQGLVHHDLRPVNVRLDQYGDVRLVDFSMTKMPPELRPDSSAAGPHDTDHYVWPQQAVAPLEVDYRADLYSLGVLAFRMFTGSLPDNEPWARLKQVTGLAPAVADLIVELLRINEYERPSVASDLLRQVREARTGEFEPDSEADLEPSTQDLPVDQFEAGVKSDDATVMMPATEQPDYGAGPDAPEQPDLDADVPEQPDYGADAPEQARNQLRSKINALVTDHGVISDEERQGLLAMAIVAGLDDDELDALIKEVISEDPQLTARHRLARLVTGQAARADGHLSDAMLDSFADAGRLIGWDRDKLRSLIDGAPGPEPRPAVKAPPPPRPEKQAAPSDPAFRASREPAPTASKQSSKPPTKPPSKPPSRPARRSPLRPWMLWVVVVAIVAVAGAFLLPGMLGDDPLERRPVGTLVDASGRTMEQAWEEAQSQDTVEGYQAFLQAWPGAFEAHTARQRLAALTVPETTEPETMVPESDPAVDDALLPDIQARLERLGYAVSASGRLDEATENAIRTFERDHGLPVTGRADDLLLMALEEQLRERDRAAWQAAVEADTEMAYLDYLSDFPDGQQRVEARDRVERARVAAERELAAMRQAEQQRLERERALAEERRVRELEEERRREMLEADQREQDQEAERRRQLAEAEQRQQQAAEAERREREQVDAEQRRRDAAAERERLASSEAEQARLREPRGTGQGELIELVQAEFQRLGRETRVSGALDGTTVAAIEAFGQATATDYQGQVSADLLRALIAHQTWPQPAEMVTDTPEPVDPGPPVVVRRVEPDYPRRAIRDRIEGWVILEFTVNERGMVENVSVAEASHRRIFDREAQAAIEQWRFEPRIVNGQPEPFPARQRFDFTLQ
jgi:TonB family protein